MSGRLKRNLFVQIMLTNDDGIYAPGLAALHDELVALGDVRVVSPATEQSGVGHSITFLTPLVAKKIFHGDEFWGWAVEGSPADCVKLGVFELCPKPDLIVSGINGGLNAGINVLYSGTVAASIEGAFFGINSIAVSLEYDEHADFATAAKIAVKLIRQIVTNNTKQGQLFNINIPTAAIANPQGVKVVPMGVARYGEHYIKRQDPKGRDYYWATNGPPPQPDGKETDLTELAAGFITVTPLDYDLTRHHALDELRTWNFSL